MYALSLKKGMEFFVEIEGKVIAVVGTGDSWRPKYGIIISNDILEVLKMLLFSETMMFEKILLNDQQCIIIPKKILDEETKEQHLLIDSKGHMHGICSYCVPNSNQIHYMNLINSIMDKALLSLQKKVNKFDERMFLVTNIQENIRSLSLAVNEALPK